MFLRAGAVSLVLLLASRVLGLVRETAQAAAFGSTALGDVAVLLFTLPDLVAGIFVSGALAYVLLPAWGQAPPGAVNALQRRVAGGLLGLGTLVLLAVALARAPLAQWLAPGAVQVLGPAPVAQALLWGAVAAPLALLAALWVTRLQHEHDLVGMYAANLVVNGVLVIAIFFIANQAISTPGKGIFGHTPLDGLGGGLLLAGALRLLWLRWRLPAVGGPMPLAQTAQELPSAAIWLWAALSAGLPQALLLVARSAASGGGEGALASFNYAWKLVELPLVLAVQLVVALAFARVAQSSGAARQQAVRQTLLLAWTLACAACAGVAGFAPALARLLFGYGRMDPVGLAQVALWAGMGAWSLLPQALIAVLLTLLASTRGLRVVALAYALALGLLLGVVTMLPLGGEGLMLALNLVLALVAGVLVLASLGALERWPWRELLAPLAACLVCVLLARQMQGLNPLWGLMGAMLAATLVIAVAWVASPGLRQTLRRTAVPT